MDTNNFEDELKSMSKPGVSQLSHQEMLEAALMNAKDESAISWWWIAIPLYVIATLLMKSFYTHTTLFSNIHEMSGREKYFSLAIFVVIPLFFLVWNVVSVRKIYRLSGGSKSLSFLKLVWLNLLFIVLCVLVLIIYF